VKHTDSTEAALRGLAHGDSNGVAAMNGPEVSVAVVAKHNPLAFLLLLTKFVIEVDGAEQDGRWGQRTIAVMPGEHTVRMWFRYMGKKCGVAEVLVKTAPGSETSISYKAPTFVFSPGKTKVSP
jgi:hypothetical protein